MDYYVTLAVLYALHAIRVYKSHWKLNDAQNEKQGKHAQKSAQSGDEQDWHFPCSHELYLGFSGSLHYGSSWHLSAYYTSPTHY